MIDLRWRLPDSSDATSSATRLVLHQAGRVLIVPGRSGPDGWFSAEVAARSLADEHHDWDVEVLADERTWLPCMNPIGDYPRLRTLLKPRRSTFFVDGQRHTVSTSYSASNSLVIRVRPRLDDQ